MDNKEKILRKALTPFGIFYRIAVNLRNCLYDWGVLKSIKYDIPVISIGNITVGGTGKTPHTEYLIELLQNKYKVAMISRGYKRKTKNFVLATPQSDAAKIGDEPMQIKRKYPDVIVAVDSNRRRAIEQLLNHPNPENHPDLILLDDAFQHRKITPSLSILLIDSNRMIHEDKLLPAGNLREPVGSKTRAHVVIVTKCTEKLKPIDYRIIIKILDLYPYQKLFFTTQEYENLKPVFPVGNLPNIPLSKLSQYDNILLVTGIAAPELLQRKMQELTRQLNCISYPDHYDFKEKDLRKIEETFNRMEGERKRIVVTEKDAMRLMAHSNASETIKQNTYYLPIKIRFIQKQEAQFEKKIIECINNPMGDSLLV